MESNRLLARPWIFRSVRISSAPSFDAYGRDGAAVAQLMEELKSGGGFQISQGALEFLRETFASGRASEEETAATITRTAQDTAEVLCPHSAVGVHVAETYLSATPMVTLATAHPAKFPDAVEDATGARPALPERMADLFRPPGTGYTADQ